MLKPALALCSVLSLANVALAAIPPPPPQTEAREYADRMSEVREEIASTEREIEEQTRERAVMERVIELASADLEKAEHRREARRIRRIIEQYRTRLEHTEDGLVQLKKHRERLVEVLADLESRDDVAAVERLEALRAQALAQPGPTTKRHAPRERQALLNELEALRLAVPAFGEADEPDAVERLELAIRLRERTLQNPRDEDLPELRKKAPDLDELRELLALSAELWREFGHEGRAETIGRMSEALWTRGGRAGEESAERDHTKGDGDALLHRIENLQKQLEHVSAMLEAMFAELEDVKRAVGKR